MSDMWDHADDDAEGDAEHDASPICDACGVSALPPEIPGEPSMCENADCPAFGEPICS